MGMSDKTIRHLVSALGTLVCVLVYLAGYVGGRNGWWWTVIGVGVVYYALYHLIEA